MRNTIFQSIELIQSIRDIGSRYIKRVLGDYKSIIVV